MIEFIRNKLPRTIELQVRVIQNIQLEMSSSIGISINLDVLTGVVPGARINEVK